jgi:hypothetical protein
MDHDLQANKEHIINHDCIDENAFLFVSYSSILFFNGMMFSLYCRMFCMELILCRTALSLMGLLGGVLWDHVD